MFQTMNGLLRRRGGASAFVAQAYLNHKREEIQASIRNRLHQATAGDASYEDDGDNYHNDDIESQSLLSSSVSSFYRTATASGNGNGAGSSSITMMMITCCCSCAQISNLVITTVMTVLISDYKTYPCLSRAIFVIAILSFFMNLSLVLSWQTMISCLSGTIATVVAVVVFVRQFQLANFNEFRNIHNALRQDVNTFAKENITLTNSINQLQNQVGMLQQQEAALAQCAQEQRTNTQHLVSLVKRNNFVQTEMKELIKQQLIATLMGMVMQGERDESDDFSQAEIQRMIMYMRGLAPAVQINEDLLRQAIQKNNSALAILRLVQDIGREGIQEGDHIFIIQEDWTQEELLKSKLMEEDF